MGGPAVTEFYVIQLKADSSIDDVGTEAHDALKSAVAGLETANGSQKVLFGRQIENPSVGVLAVGKSNCPIW